MPPGLFGLDIGARGARAQNDNPGFAIFEVVVLVLLAIAVANIRRSDLGRRFLSVRFNERAAAVSGHQRRPHEAVRLRHQRGDRRHRRRDARLQAGRGVVRQLPYAASLALLAFAYLGGITSVNGAVVGGLLVAGGARRRDVELLLRADDRELPRDHRRARHDPDGDHSPEGIAPFLQGSLRHAGNWLISAIPGARTLSEAYAGRSRRFLNVVFVVLLVSTWPVWLKLLFDTIIDNIPWALFSGFLAWLVLLAVASRLGPISPTFGEAGQRWASAAVRFGPTAPRRLRPRMVPSRCATTSTASCTCR